MTKTVYELKLTVYFNFNNIQSILNELTIIDLSDDITESLHKNWHRLVSLSKVFDKFGQLLRFKGHGN